MKKLLVLITLIFVAKYATAQTNCYVPTMNGPVKLSQSMLYCDVQDSVDVTKILGFGNLGHSRVLTLGSGFTVTDSVISASGGGGWSLTGNAGTNPSTNFIGTTDAQPFKVRTNNVERWATDYVGSTQYHYPIDITIVDYVAGVNALSITKNSPTSDTTSTLNFQDMQFNWTLSRGFGSNTCEAFCTSDSISIGVVNGDITFQATDVNPSYGKVGIGTSTPTSKIHVLGTALIKDSVDVGGFPSVTFLKVNANDLESKIESTYNDGTNFYTSNVIANAQRTTVGYSITGGSNQDNKIEIDGNAIAFLNLNGEVMRVDAATSNVGIGTASPAYKLDVDGPFRNTYNNGNEIHLISNVDDAIITTCTSLITGGIGGIEQYSAAIDIYVLDTIAGGGMHTYMTSGLYQIDDKEGTSFFRINKNTGNVGIGSTTPSDKLHVVGDFKLTGTIKGTALPAFDDDADAASLSAGDFYQTTGAGAAPLNVAGIVMVKQ